MKARVLILDENEALNVTLNNILVERGYEVFTFSDRGVCPLFHTVDHIGRKTLAEMDKHRGMKRRFGGKFLEPAKVLQIRVFLDLLNTLFISKSQTFLDDECRQRHSYGKCWWSLTALGQVGTVIVFKFVPWNQF